MPSKPRGRNISEADLEAAARLKSLWLAIPADRRPTQPELAARWDGEGDWNQSLVSQYMNGRIALNYRAVLFFARQLGVQPHDIRSDLPEQRLGAAGQPDHSPVTTSQLLQLDPDTVAVTAQVLQEFLRRRGHVFDITDPVDAGLFCDLYPEALATASDDPVGMASLGAAVVDLMQRRGERERREEPGQPAAGKSGEPRRRKAGGT